MSLKSVQGAYILAPSPVPLLSRNPRRHMNAPFPSSSIPSSSSLPLS